MSRYDDYDVDERPVRKSSGSGKRPANGSGKRPPSQGGQGKRPANASGKRPPSDGPNKRSSNGRPSNGKPAPERKGNGPKKAKKKKKTATKIIIFIIELVVLVVAGLVLYGTLTTTKSGKVEIKEEAIVINETVKEAEETTMKGYRNIALFGVDSRASQLTNKTRTDTIMIASINQDTGDIKLVSVYRDTYLNLGNDTYNKCNAAYAKGGPEQAINMLNMNLDMNITDFVTVGFEGLIDVIDALGGVQIDVHDDEITHLNNYQRSMFLSEDGSGKLNENIVEVTSTGPQTLSGLQATAYCRIRYTSGDDFRRAERQRTVLMACMDKAKNASASQLSQIANNVFDKIYTSLDLDEIIELLGNIGNYSVVAQGGFPEESHRATGTIGAKGSCVIPVNLSENVKWLHEFLFNDSDYTPSATVESCSDQVYSDTHSYIGN